MPDIDADIVKYEITPGDVLLFHSATLHGGGAAADRERRTVTFRFYGDDIVYAKPIAGRQEPEQPGMVESNRVGEPLRSSSCPQVRPRSMIPPR